MRKPVFLTRASAILRYKKQLERDSFPRLQMSLIVATTGGVGLLVSFLLLHAGMASMAVRYPMSLAVAYLAFLFLLWVWLRHKADDFNDLFKGSDTVAEAAIDIGPDILSNIKINPSAVRFASGQGGNFGGSGASSLYDAPVAQTLADVGGDSGSSVGDGLGDTLGDTLGSVGDADELAIPILVLVFVVGLALASLSIVYSAPALFAELLVDNVLSYALYRHLNKVETRYWLRTALTRTAIPFALTAVFLAMVGTALTHYAPGARSIGEAIHYSNAVR
jgi:hypothetical protein